MIRSFVALSAISLALLLGACATIVPLEGGAKDETPPGIVEGESTANFQVRFFPTLIELTFDEWITLDDVFNQVVISPPLEYRADISLKGRTVLVEFDEREKLRSEATYTINFGTSIKDLTERNPAENLRFVFSTGDYLDSLSVEGRIVDALTGEPVEKALFMLYDNLTDSVVRTERPLYFGRTNKEGNFRIPNVRADTLKGFALLDTDLNYRYNQSRERIGFPVGLLSVSDSNSQSLLIRLFEEKRPIKLLESDTKGFGQVKVTYNQKPEFIQLFASDSNIVLFAPELLGDSVRVWYQKKDTAAWQLQVIADSIITDTLSVKSGIDLASFATQSKLQLLAPNQGITAVVHPDANAQLTFNRPISKADTSLILWTEDTIKTPITPVWKLDSVSVRTINSIFPWKETLIYEMQALPGAFTDIFGLANPDTIALRWRIDQRKNYATLNLLIEGMDSEQKYYLSLLNTAKTEVFSRQVSGAETGKITFTPLQPGQYSLRVVLDDNGNGQWDAGIYDLDLQPEAVYFFPLEQLRANWELETKVALPKG
jgi:hypothetical protein